MQQLWNPTLSCMPAQAQETNKNVQAWATNSCKKGYLGVCSQFQFGPVMYRYALVVIQKPPITADTFRELLGGQSRREQELAIVS